MVFSSTAAVYGMTGLPRLRDTPLNPIVALWALEVDDRINAGTMLRRRIP